MSVDPLSESNLGHSTYRFGFNNPLAYDDPLGLEERKVQDLEGKWHTITDNDVTVIYQREESMVETSDPDDHIYVNSEGIVTKVVEEEGSNKFFDSETGEELFFNDPKKADSFKLIKDFTVGDQLYQLITGLEMKGLIAEGTFEPFDLRAEGKYTEAYKLTAKYSKSDRYADFPMKLAYRYKRGRKTVGDGHTEVIGTPFKFPNHNMIYNPSDAGQFLWGAWMQINGYRLIEVIAGSNLNEISSGGDSAGDQRAIKAGFKYFK